MHLSHSPAEPTDKERFDQDRGSGNTCPHQTPAVSTTTGTTTTTTAITPTARLPHERSYRTLARGSVTADAADAVAVSTQERQFTPNTSLNAPETLVSRQQGLRLSAAAIGGPQISTVINTLAHATSTSPNTCVTPTSVRGRSGSIGQHRVYQPSSLFGTSTASTALAASVATMMTAAASSLSSSQLLTDATHRRVASAAINDQSASAFTAAGGNETDDDCEKTTGISAVSASQRRFLDVSPGAEALRGIMPSTLRRVSGLFSGSDASTFHMSAEKLDSMCGNSAGETTVGRRADLTQLQSSTLIPLLVAANADVPSPSAAAAANANTNPNITFMSSAALHGKQCAATLSDVTAAFPPQEACEVGKDEPIDGADALETTVTTGGAAAAVIEANESKVNLAKRAADAAQGVKTEPLSDFVVSVGNVGDRSASRVASNRDETPPPFQENSKQQRRETPKRNGTTEEQGVDDAPVAMAPLAVRVAVPLSVQAVLKNPAATKEELWMALRTACQQCELLQRRLAKVEGHLTEEDKDESDKHFAVSLSRRNAEAANTTGSSSSSTCNASGDNNDLEKTYHMDKDKDVAQEESKSSGATASKQQETTSSSGTARVDEDTADTEADAHKSMRNHQTTSLFSHAIANTQAAEAAGRATRDCIASVVAAAAPVSPLSISALLRTNARVNSNATTPYSTTSANPDVSSVLRSRFAEEIRRVEATRRGGGGGSTQTGTPEAPDRRGEEYRTKTDKVEDHSVRPSASSNVTSKKGVGSDDSNDNDDNNSGNSGNCSNNDNNRNAAVKVPDDAVMQGKRRVDENVVKFCQAESSPPLRTHTPIPHESQLPSHTDSEGDNNENDVEVENGDVGDRDNDGGTNNASVGRNGMHRTTFKRQPSNVSDTASVKSSNGFALPSIPFASVGNLRKSSFMSRSNNSGRLAAPRPPSSSASESVAASSMTGSSAFPQHAFHRRQGGASLASVDSASNGREGSVASSGPGGHGGGGISGNGVLSSHNDSGSPSSAVPPIFVRALAASTTLPALKNEDVLKGPLSARPAHHPKGSSGNDNPASGPRSSRDLLRDSAGVAVGNVMSHLDFFDNSTVQQSNWLPRTSPPASPTNGALPSIPSSSSPSQKSIVPRSPFRSPANGTINVSSTDQVRSRSLKKQQLQPSSPGMHGPTPNKTANSRVLSPLPQSQGSNRGSVSSSTAATAPPSISEMVRQMAEEDAPVPPPFADENAELREWRRQAAKVGMHGAPPAF